MTSMRLLSPRELADALGVSESSLKRWVDAGKIHAMRTEGGHRRIALTEAVRFVRETGAPVARPELLDMPEVAVAQQRTLHGVDQLLDYLLEGDVVGARGWLLSRYLAGVSIHALCDGPVRDAMHRLGELWRHDDAGVFIEHRGTDVCLQALSHLRGTFEPSPHAPLALGGTPEDDPYIIPSVMCATVIAAAGMRTMNLGPDTPVGAFQHAFAAHAPRLVWISASASLPPARARALAHWLQSLPPNVTTVTGGRASRPLREAGVRHAETMGELFALAASLVPSHRSPDRSPEL
jgi:MerR family transcriptional regulator, light-induced transcriptional regulator